MINESLYNLATGIIWQDVKSLIRTSESDDSTSYAYVFVGAFTGGGTGLVFGFLYDFGILLAIIGLVLGIIITLIPPLRRDIALRKLRANAYDVEVTTCDIKIIRNHAGKYGLICWPSDKNSESLRHVVINSVYSNITRLNSNVYLCKTKGKIGLYNFNMSKMVIPCIYDTITPVSDKIVLASSNVRSQKFNHEGERILW